MIELSEEQVLAFRQRRQHVLGPGAADPAAAARAIFGSQAQVELQGALALSVRTEERPALAEVVDAMFGEQRSLVRTWGPRGTIHIYAPSDWAPVVAATPTFGTGGRRGPHLDEQTLDRAAEFIAGLGRTFDRSELDHLIPEPFCREAAESAGYARMTPARFGSSRVVWQLSRRGDLSHGPKVGSKQHYAARSLWFPDLPWPAADPAVAPLAMVRRYLSAFGPADDADIAHYLGARVTMVRTWLSALAPELVAVRCGDRVLSGLAVDEQELQADPPDRWPVRLLPLYDTLLMGHADKGSTVPHEPDRRRIWRKAAYVAGPVLVDGRVAAIWAGKKKGKRYHIELEPLSRWQPKHRKAAEQEAAEIARILGLDASFQVL